MNQVRLSHRSQRVAPFHVMALLQRAQALEAKGGDVIHLEVGEPDFPCPEPIMAAAAAALQAGQTRYTAAMGLPVLREAIAGWYQSTFGIKVDPGRVVVTPGASGALQLALAALVDPGQSVLVTDPGYPCNRHFLALVDGEPVTMVVEPQALDGDCIRRHWREGTVAALLASPDNPTGTLLPAATLEGVAQAVRENGGTLIVDEIYQGLVYGRPPSTVLSVAPDALVVNSFSKYFGMTGWRLGWLVAPEEMVPSLERLAQNFFIAPSTPAQHAAIAAFQPETLAELERRRAELDRRRRFLLERLPALGMKVVGKPEGAFYIYLDVSAVTNDSYGFCERLLEETGVALTPGIDFGTGHGADTHLRIAYAAPVARLEEALQRIARFIQR